MTDPQIIELYWNRDERAIHETKQKYGSFCLRIAINILTSYEDAEECVNDVYYRVWQAIPPQRPTKFRAWIGKIVRNTAITLWDRNHARKRFAGMNQLLSELEDCIPSPQTLEREMEGKELSDVIDGWLASLSKEERTLFMRRYWNGEALKDLARTCGMTPGKLAQRMYRLRSSLRETLEREGIQL